MTLQKRILVTLAAALLLGGCAAGPYEKSRPVTTASSIRIPAPIVYSQRNGELELKIAILGGEYQAAREDAQGIYYVGPHGCYTSTLVKGNWVTPEHALNKTMASDCGIYLPATASEPARLFIIDHGMRSSWEVTQGVQPVVAGSVPGASIGQAALGTAIGVGIVQSIVESNEGQYVWTREQPPGSLLRDHIAQ